MANHLKRGTGHLKKKSNGRLSIGCGVSCNVCSSGSPPTTIQLVLSGITLCTDCMTDEFFHNDARITSGAAPNGTYCLTFESGTDGLVCTYSAPLDVPIVVTFYNSNDLTCSGGVFETLTIDKVRIVFSPAAGFSSASQTIQVLGSRSWAWIVFRGFASGSPNCADKTVSNLTSSCGWLGGGGLGSAIVLGTGGTATTTINGC